MFRKHWLVQGNRPVQETGAEAYLTSLGIAVEDANEFVKEKREQIRIEVVGPLEKPLPRDSSHPEYKERPCYMAHRDQSLLEGLSQAQIITKSIHLSETLPDKVERLAEVKIPESIHACVKKVIMSANVFDCEQNKLPKIKDKDRPAYNFKRILGITEKRKNLILSNKLMQLIERSSDHETSGSKHILSDVECVATIEKDDNLFQFDQVSNLLVTSDKPLHYKSEVKDTENIEIPDLHPITHTITLPTDHFYTGGNSYPVAQKMHRFHPHTSFLLLDREKVCNLYSEPLTENQIRGRTLMHCFTVAAAYAKQIHGDDVDDLPEPTWVNCVHVDGNLFHIGMLQLNTLNLNGRTGKKNVWYSLPRLALYGSCQYEDGVPTLKDYNPKVYGYLNAIYNC